MSNEYGFFASKNHDRQYSADDFSAFFGDFFTNGVLGKDTNALAVSPAGDMKLSVSAGAAYAKGRWYRTQSAGVLELSDSDTLYPRIDAAVIRFDFEQRMVYPLIIEGEPAEAPENPEHIRDDKYFDLVLAYIYVEANCTGIAQSDITDMRGFDNVCGFVTSAIDHIDTSGLFAQYKAHWELLKAACEKDAAGVISAWDALNSARTVNGLEPVNGDISIVQGDIPSGKGSYRFPFYMESGTLAFTSANFPNKGIAVTFPKKFKSPPLIIASVTSFDSVTIKYPASVNYADLTEEGVVFVMWGITSNNITNNLSGTVNWIALGEYEEEEAAE